MDQMQEFLEYAKHTRHDWLNHLQVIKGYMALGKMEDVQKFIDHIIVQAHDESKISQLGDKELTYFLLTHHLKKSPISLEFEIEAETEEIHQLGQDHPVLGRMIQQIVTIMEASCSPQADNQLLIVLRLEAGMIKIGVEFEGSWKNDGQGREETVRQIKQLADSAHSCLSLLQAEENKCIVEISME